ncbi:Homeodomain-like domain-containing protein [Micromonospora pisi]|uniref:Homeodomain-like domain-containing protein n=1 Tax=Micromonospora pisi TaxID=589240 RepID=A0A495JJR7_9ACTN|nr:helix-turn-helix domain-containing protein [Micromonospora pisi]RKR88634.1 Homeodomain-like domain-containing protein [Micromonospora pisi]
MTDELAAEARRLRTVEGLSVGQIRARLGIGKDRLYELLRGVPAPDWTRRPNAKDEVRARALRLREEGWSVTEIATELDVAKSTAYQWVKHLPLDPDSPRARRRQAHSRRMTDARWAEHRRERDERQAAVHAAEVDRLGRLSERELLLIGAAIYWCEGSKSKPWRRNDRLTFTNSDPGLLALFLRFLDACGVDRRTPSYRLSIHESADVEAATSWWIEVLGLPVDRVRAPTLKRHRPTTNRRNTDELYRGCLVIDVPGSRELYWRIEGVNRALAAEALKRFGQGSAEALG